MQITQVKLDTVYDVPSEMKYHHKMTEKEVAFADGWNSYRCRMLGLQTESDRVPQEKVISTLIALSE